MIAKEIRSKDVKGLGELLLKLLREQFDHRIKKGLGDESVPTHKAKQLRRDIARVKTIMNEKAKDNDK